MTPQNSDQGVISSRSVTNHSRTVDTMNPSVTQGNPNQDGSRRKRAATDSVTVTGEEAAPRKRLETPFQAALKELRNLVKDKSPRLEGVLLLSPKYRDLRECWVKPDSTSHDRRGRRAIDAARLASGVATLTTDQASIIVQTLVAHNCFELFSADASILNRLLAYFGLPEEVRKNVPNCFITCVYECLRDYSKRTGLDAKGKGYVVSAGKHGQAWHPMTNEIVRHNDFNGCLPQLSASKKLRLAGSSCAEELIDYEKASHEATISLGQTRAVFSAKDMSQPEKAKEMVIDQAIRQNRPVKVLENLKVDAEGNVRTPFGIVGELSSGNPNECKGLKVHYSGMILDDEDRLQRGTVAVVPGDALEMLCWEWETTHETSLSKVKGWPTVKTITYPKLIKIED